jgi:hypothetical protein
MQALAAILSGVLMVAALVYGTGRLITPRESRCPPLARSGAAAPARRPPNAGVRACERTAGSIRPTTSDG